VPGASVKAKSLRDGLRPTLTRRLEHACPQPAGSRPKRTSVPHPRRLDRPRSFMDDLR